MNWFISLWSHLLLISFHLLYHQLAPLYDVISWIVSFGQWRAWQTAVLPFIAGIDVLELGHGPGHMLVSLWQEGYRVSGVDLSPQMSQLAKQRIRQSGIQAAIVRARAQRLPLAAASYDTVLATFPTEYIAGEETLREVNRVLRENGRLVILPQARLTGDALPVRLLEGLYRVTGQRVIPQSAHDAAAVSPLITTALRRFQESGFEVHMEQVDLPGSEVTILILTKEKSIS